MRVSVRLFAIARERAGTAEAWLELPAGATVEQALEELGRCFKALPPVLRRAMVAVNREYAGRDQHLQHGDELAVIPPVSGGAGALPLRQARGPFGAGRDSPCERGVL